MRGGLRNNIDNAIIFDKDIALERRLPRSVNNRSALN